MNIMQCLNRFSGCAERKKTHVAFMFFSWSKGRFGAHISASGSLFGPLARKMTETLSEMVFLVSVVTLYELGKFKRFFQTGIFIGGLEGRFGEHQKRANFTFLHFSRRPYYG